MYFKIKGAYAPTCQNITLVCDVTTYLIPTMSSLKTYASLIVNY
jgi:hypothetical protein